MIYPGAAWTPSLGTLIERAGAARREARWNACEALAVRGLVFAARAGFPIETVELLSQLGAVAFERGELQQAERRFGEALALARRRGTAAGEAAALVNLGAVANVRGRFFEALACYRRGRWAFARAGNPRGEARALNNLGMLFADLRRWNAANRCYRQARRRAAAAGDDALVGLVALNAVEVLLAGGRPEAARESCDEAVERLTIARDALGTAEAHRFYGQIYRATGEPRLAELHLRRAARSGRSLGAPLTEAEALRELGYLHIEQGRHRRALESFGRSLKLFRRMDAAYDLAALGDKMEELEAILVRIVQELGREVEARDRYLYGHSSRVAEYAVAVACDLGFAPDEMKGVLVASYLHDIGKLQIDPAILGKEDRLTPEELQAVRRHPLLGVEHLKRFELPWDVEAIIRGHHERWDGTGYPDGLAGEAIPLGARILLVADVFDALTTARPYRAPWTREQALTYLRMSAGQMADADVVAAFEVIAVREAYASAGGEPDVSAMMSPADVAEALAALPGGDAWSRLDEELART